MRKYIYAASLLSALAVSATMEQAANAATAGTPYNIDVILSLTGTASFLGNSEQHAIKIEQAVINAGDGIHGHPVNFVFHDDQSSGQIAVQLANQVLATHPKVIIGPTLVASCNAVAPLVRNDGPVMYCLSPGVHPTKPSYMFSASTSTADMIAATLHYYQLRGWTRIAILTATDATGQDAAKAIKAEMGMPENKALTLVADEHFNPSDVTVDPEIQAMKASNAQALIVWTSGTSLGTALRGIANAGWNVPVATTHANMQYKQMAQYKAFIPQQFYIASPPAVFPSSQKAGDTANVQAVRSEMFGAFTGMGQKPDMGVALSWDPVLIAVNALNTLPDSATNEQIRDYIANLTSYAGINGIYNMQATPQRGLSLQNVIMTRWDAAKSDFVVVGGPGGTPF
ncbi:MAG TPA: ABC transporter substrate-binding protein [Acidocella sp.]|nr:ABC transporter substrate-binding protein [Acidocella sp.]